MNQLRNPKKIYTYVQIFNMKSDSSGDIHLAHIEKKNQISRASNLWTHRHCFSANGPG